MGVNKGDWRISPAVSTVGNLRIICLMGEGSIYFLIKVFLMVKNGTLEDFYSGFSNNLFNGRG